MDKHLKITPQTRHGDSKCLLYEQQYEYELLDIPLRQYLQTFIESSRAYTLFSTAVDPVKTEANKLHESLLNAYFLTLNQYPYCQWISQVDCCAGKKLETK